MSTQGRVTVVPNATVACQFNSLSFITQWQLLLTLGKKLFENILRKGENAGNQQFLLFPQFFLLYEKQIQFYE